MYLCTQQNQSTIWNKVVINEWETFTIVNRANLTSNNMIPTWGSMASFRTHWNKYLSAEYNRVLGCTRDQPDHFHVTITGLSGDVN